MAKENFYATGYAKNYAEFEPVELDSTPQTRTVFEGHMSDKGIGGNIIRYRLGKDGKAELIKQDFKNIEPGDGVKTSLVTVRLTSWLIRFLNLTRFVQKAGLLLEYRSIVLLDRMIS